MPRPIKKGLDYFPHDTDAAGDDKIMALVAKYGAAGYAVYFYLLEKIYRTEHGELRMDEIKVYLYSTSLKLSVNEFEKIVEDAVLVGCFDADAYKANILTSSGVKKRIALVNKVRNKWRTQKSRSFSAEENGVFREENA